MTLSRRDVVELLAANGLSPKRSLGQNFVVDPNTVRRIARLAGVGPGDRVLEIGAGLGSLTLALAETGASVTAVEIDARLVPVLRSVVEPAGVRVVVGDAMALDWDAVLGDDAGGEPDRGGSSPGLSPGSSPGWSPGWSLVANLPYNVATPLVVTLLERVPVLRRLLVMVQAEVGDRLAAQPGDRAYGAVSVLIAYWAVARVVGTVPPTVFIPRPKVESALVRIERRPAPAVDPTTVSYERLKSVVRAGFGQRRKMLRRSLAAVVDPGAFDGAGIRPQARAEDLGVEEWGRLAGWQA